MLDAEMLRSLLPLALAETNLPLPGKASGMVWDWYTLPQGRLLVNTDRLSAFKRTLGQVPFKGQALNQLSAWWFGHTSGFMGNHALTMPDPNALVVVAAEPFNVKVIVHGYITGVTSNALWHYYSLGEREIYGHRFPERLRKNQALPEPIVTPIVKGVSGGHDERLTCAEVVKRGLMRAAEWDQVYSAALTIYKFGQETAQHTGLILVDTRYGFGRDQEGRILLIDELHTPDSSHFWQADSYVARFAAGDEPENYDPDFIRLAFMEKNYRGDGIPPGMPDDLWIAASQRYISIYERLTGRSFEPGAYPVEPRLLASLRRAALLPLEEY